MYKTIQTTTMKRLDLFFFFFFGVCFLCYFSIFIQMTALPQYTAYMDCPWIFRAALPQYTAYMDCPWIFRACNRMTSSNSSHHIFSDCVSCSFEALLPSTNSQLFFRHSNLPEWLLLILHGQTFLQEYKELLFVLFVEFLIFTCDGWLVPSRQGFGTVQGQFLQALFYF